MQVKIETSKGEVLAVKVQDDAKGIHIQTHCNWLYPGEHPWWFQNIYSDDRKHIQTVSDLGWSEYEPKGFKLIAPLSEVTEEIAQDLLPRKSIYSGLIKFKYFDYINKNFTFDTALDSFKSLMQANEVYYVNPYSNECKCEVGLKQSQYDSCLEEIKNHNRVKDKCGRWIILFKEK